jgi:hypothetical protein
MIFNLRGQLILPGLNTCLVISWLSFTSCSHYYYAPNTTNIPLLEEKEAKVNFQYASGSISNGFELQSAFAISSNFGGMVNTMFTGSKDDYSTYSNKTNSSYIEFAGGYFTPVNNTALIFETYGGIGFGGVRNDYETGRSKVGFTKFFLQPNIGVKVKSFEFAISTRFNYLFQSVRNNSLPTSEYEYQELAYLEGNPNSFLLEPGAVLRFGGKKFMIQLQYTSSINLSHPEHFLSQEVGYFGIGGSIPITYKTTQL